jgi:hypothetical protein
MQLWHIPRKLKLHVKSGALIEIKYRERPRSHSTAVNNQDKNRFFKRECHPLIKANEAAI